MTITIERCVFLTGVSGGTRRSIIVIMVISIINISIISLGVMAFFKSCGHSINGAGSFRQPWLKKVTISGDLQAVLGVSLQGFTCTQNRLAMWLHGCPRGGSLHRPSGWWAGGPIVPVAAIRIAVRGAVAVAGTVAAKVAMAVADVVAVALAVVDELLSQLQLQ